MSLKEPRGDRGGAQKLAAGRAEVTLFVGKEALLAKNDSNLATGKIEEDEGREGTLAELHKRWEREVRAPLRSVFRGGGDKVSMQEQKEEQKSLSW